MCQVPKRTRIERERKKNPFSRKSTLIRDLLRLLEALLVSNDPSIFAKCNCNQTYADHFSTSRHHKDCIWDASILPMNLSIFPENLFCLVVITLVFSSQIPGSNDGLAFYVHFSTSIYLKLKNGQSLCFQKKG